MNEQMTTINLLSETLNLAVADLGQGRAYLLLHGGAGPASMAGLAAALSQNARALVPTHPGFAGQPRPEWFARVEDLATAYLALLERLGVSNVVVIGNSLGGWIAAEMALRQSPRISGIVLLNAVGITAESPDQALVDPLAVEPAERLALSFFNPQKFASLPSGPQLAAMAENQKALRVYSGEALVSATLQPRLVQIAIPTLIAWGESDKVANVNYGRSWAASIAGAQFELVTEAGHFPHIERLDEVVRLIDGFDVRK